MKKMKLRIKKIFKNWTLKRKMMLIYCGFFLIPLFLVCAIIYNGVSNSLREKIEYSAIQGYDQSSAYLEYKLQQLIQRTDGVVNNRGLSTMVQEYREMGDDFYQKLLQKEKIRKYLQTVESTTENLQLRIYFPDDFEVIRDNIRIFTLSDADSSVWYQKKGTQKIYFAPECYIGDNSGYVSLVRDIFEENNYRKRSAVLRLDISLEEIVNILKKATPTEHAVTYLINRENILIASSNEDVLNDSDILMILSEAPGNSSYSKVQNLRKINIDQTEYLYMKKKIKNTDWEMVTLIPESDITQGIARVQYNVLILMLVFGLVTIAGFYELLTWIVKRIALLNDTFKQVQEGNTGAYLIADSKDEIGVLYDNYNHMMERTNQLMDEKYRMGIYLKSAELKALQSQINPHFLYNTLDMVNWLAYSGRTEEISMAVVALSKYYRLVLNKGEDTLTLRDELEHVGHYIKIQNIRFSEKIHYTESVDEDIKDMIVPKIILQPLVENAIIHGIWGKKEKSGTIRILGYAQEKKVYVKIIDDGIGIEAAALSQIMTGTKSTTGSGYGVKNVHARLQLMFGEEYGLIYESRENEGTCVTVCIPK